MALDDARVAILVPSCDAYADLWETFFGTFRRFWPDCPFKVHLLTNRLRPTFGDVAVVAVGEDEGWSAGIIKALDRVTSEFVFLWIEDLFLVSRVDSNRVRSVFERALGLAPNYVRFIPSPPPTSRVDDLLGLVGPGDVYRTSTVLSLWRASALRSLLVSGETAWQFEIDGSRRADAIPGFYSTLRPEFEVLNGVIKGKWRPPVLRRLRALGYEPGPRSVMTWRERVRFRYHMLRSWILLSVVPVRHRRAVKGFVAKHAPWI